MVTVRPATVADAPAMGRVHVRAWQAAYRGQMPDAYLDGLRPEQRAAGWEAALGELARLGYTEAVLWVLPANRRARRFYEIAGWVATDSRRTTEVLGVV